jgi:O-antigen/teichoic acid export membrane protein
LSSGDRPGPIERVIARLPGLTDAGRSTWEPLLKGSLVALGVTALAQLLALGLQVLLARLLEPAEFGVYSFVFSGIGLCLIVAKFGLDTTLVRLVAEYLARDDAARLRGLVRFARLTGSTLGVVVALVFLFLVVVNGAGQDSSLSRAIVVGAVLLPFAVYSELTAAALRGMRRIVAALSGDGLLRPCVVGMAMLLLAAGWPAMLTSSSALLAYIGGTIASLLMTNRILNRAMPQSVAVADVADIRRYLRVAVSLMMASGFLVAMYSLDTVMLGFLYDTTNAGFYSVASRIALVVLFVMNATQTVAAPMLATAAAVRQPAQVRVVVRTMNGLAIVAAVPASIVLLVAAEPIMGVFGSDFREAVPAFRLLVVSQLLNVLTGPTGMVLSMSGHEQTLVRLLFAGLVLNGLLNVLWIPDYGLMGAAASALVAHVSWNVAGALLIRARMSIDITPFDLLRPSEERVA